ncbi:proteasomal ubiquitin receptor ADRM1-B isoform X2 [Hydra vulgaris]|uniref:Proteasomal ubiquitin receptor ADRM1-B isoform X2 n=1 Tax=Hydra vulgaris TaxID=6087 RepID=A0ABM4BS29_HYDVU
MALFGSSAVSSSKNLVSFRAGKMNLKGTTVTADKRKGLVYVYQSDDSLMHFCWKDRTTGTLEDDLIIFPDDVEFKRVNECKTGRVYVLKFKSSTRKFFFWMQEPKEDKDEENCKKVDDMLNNPPTPGISTGPSNGNSGAGLPPALASLGDQIGDSSLQSLLNNMDQNQLMQLLGMTGLGSGDLSGGISTRPNQDLRNISALSQSRAQSAEVVNNSTPAVPLNTTPVQRINNTSTPAASVQLSELQNILSNMQVPKSQESVDLSSSFSTEALLPLLVDKDVQARLQPFLPAVSTLRGSENELRETIQSPQFKQALSIFSTALQSGELAPLMQQFKLSQAAVDAAAKGDIIAFTKALQDSESSNKQHDSIEDMALD